MNLEGLTTYLGNSFDQLNIGLIVDPETELAHIMDPNECGWIIRRQFKGSLGFIYAFVVLAILSAVIGFALYDRQ